MRTINTIKLSGYLESDRRGHHERNSADRIKIVWFDGSGICLFAKRLERSHFCWPSPGSFEIRLSYAQLSALVEGLDWKRIRAVDIRAPQSVG